ncbi:hypothetical protein [Rhodopirellula sallentina]|nr:hypothetical protein [Rhodopirellula sallentina]
MPVAIRMPPPGAKKTAAILMNRYRMFGVCFIVDGGIAVAIE